MSLGIKNKINLEDTKCLYNLKMDYKFTNSKLVLIFKTKKITVLYLPRYGYQTVSYCNCFKDNNLQKKKKLIKTFQTV